MVEQTTHGAISPVDRPHPARPLHRGHLPDLRLRRRPRRPVRQLRQPARPDRPDQPAQQDQRRDAGVRRDPALLPRPAGAGRRARGVARRARGVRHLAAQRPQVLPEPARGHPAAGDDPRHRLGHPGAAATAGRSNPTKRLYVWFDAVIGYLSASIEWARRTGDPEALARSGGTTPRPLSYYFMGKDNITFHSQIWPAELLAYNGQGDKGGEPGAYGALQPADRGGLQRVPDDGGQAVLLRRAAWSSTCGDFLARYEPDALRYFICRGRAGEPGHRLHLGRVRPPQQRRARRRLGQPGQPHGDDDRARTSARSRPPATLEPSRPRRCSTPSAAGFATVGDLIAPAPAEGRDRRGDAGRRRGQQVPLRHRAVEAQGRRPSASGSARSCTSPRRSSATATRCSRRSCRTARNAVHGLLGGEGEVAPMPRDRARSTTSTAAPARYPVITGDYTGDTAPGSRGRSTAGTPVGQADAGLHQARPVGRRRGAGPAGRRRRDRAGRLSVRPAPVRARGEAR